MEPGGVVSASGSAARGRRRAPARVERGGGGAGAGAGGDAPARESHAQRRRRRRRRDPRGIGWGMDFPARLPIPDAVLRIAKQLEGAGYETWCVGGAIRDNLLKVENHDFDLTTAAPPDEVRRLFKRTVPVGIEHGTVAVLDQQNRQHEVTTFRKDIKTDGRHAVVEFGVSLMDDLARRDFTINAIAYHPLRHDWQDPFQGQQDLGKRLIRSVGDPNWRFQEDYLRILRALRFSARFEFRIHPRTLEAAKANAQGLAQLSAERVRDEWFKGIATAQKVSKLVTLWRDVGATRIWLPELRDAGDPKGLPVGRRRREKGQLDKLPRDPVLITAFLAGDPASLLTRLKSSNKDIERGRAIGQWRDKYPDPKHVPEVRRWLSAVGEHADDLLALLPALDTSRLPTPATDRESFRVSRLPAVVAAIRAAQDPLTLQELAVNGNDLIAAGVRPGPDVGEVL